MVTCITCQWCMNCQSRHLTAYAPLTKLKGQRELRQWSRRRAWQTCPASWSPYTLWCSENSCAWSLALQSPVVKCTRSDPSCQKWVFQRKTAWDTLHHKSLALNKTMTFGNFILCTFCIVNNICQYNSYWNWRKCMERSMGTISQYKIIINLVSKINTLSLLQDTLRHTIHSISLHIVLWGWGKGSVKCKKMNFIAESTRQAR